MLLDSWRLNLAEALAQLVASLSGFLLMLQSSFLDSIAFDPFSLQEDCLSVSKVDVDRGQVLQSLRVAMAIVVFHEAANLAVQPRLCGEWRSYSNNNFAVTGLAPRVRGTVRRHQAAGGDCCVCLNGAILSTSGQPLGDNIISNFSRVADCRACTFKPKCFPRSRALSSCDSQERCL